MYLYINIIDDTDGITVYNLTTPVIVTPSINIISRLSISLMANDWHVQFLLELSSGNLNLVGKNVIALATEFNIQSRLASITAFQLAQITGLRRTMLERLTQMSLSDISSIKVMLSALSALTETTSQVPLYVAVKKYFLIRLVKL